MYCSKQLSVLLSAVAFAALCVPTADARAITELGREEPVTHKVMREGGHIRAPFAFIRYCVASPGACEGGAGGPLDWSAATKAALVEVNRRINRSIRPVHDRGDTWRSDVKAGDCEDFALTKRHALLKAGFSSSALRMAVARTPSGEGHAVLVVKTTEGDFVLDNRTDRLLAWHQTDLTFVKIASAQDPRLWRRLL